MWNASNYDFHNIWSIYASVQTIKKKAVPPVTFSWYTSATALCKWDEVLVALNR